MPLTVYTVAPDAPLTSEPLGTKPKFWFLRDDRRWLYKMSRPGSGENWAEVLASLLADRLGLPHADYELAQWRGNPGVVTPRFTEDGADLVHGNELLAERDPGYERAGARYVRTRLHTIDAVRSVLNSPGVQLPFGWTAIPGIDRAVDVFAGYLLLDTWIGNPDRHHENWALVYRRADAVRALAPTFDHASSLGAHETDAVRADRLASTDPGYGIEGYVRRAKARSALYRAPTDARSLSMLEAFDVWAQGAASRPWVNRLASITPATIGALIAEFPADHVSGPARDFAAAMLEANRRRILSER